MISSGAIIVVAIVCFAIGIGIGILLTRTWVPPEQQRELERSLQAAREDLEQYQRNVAEHFVETRQRISNLADSYRGLHEHLAKGAMELTSSDVGHEILQAGASNASKEANLLDENRFDQPKDWAPKTPGEAGILSEEFGLAENKDVSGIEVKTAIPETTVEDKTKSDA